MLAGTIARETGRPLASVVSGLSIGLLVGGALSPLVGRLIQCHGRPVLVAGSALLAAGLAGLAVAPSLVAFSQPGP